MLTLPLGVTDCQVRSWRIEDAACLAQHANCRNVWLNMRDSFPHPYTLEDAQNFLRVAVAESPEVKFCIDCRGEAVGGIGLRPWTDVERFSAEIGYWLGEAHWGRGIATEAIRAVTRHGLDPLGLHRIFALPYARNAPSLRALEKAGYICEGRLRKSAFKDGRFEDQLMYALTK
jgi:RimJ/RimL family protein N-acetyltransferase